MTLKNQLVASLCAIAIFAVSCQKEAINNATSFENQINAKNSGVVEDNPADVARVPLTVSADFIKSGGSRSNYLTPKLASRGRTVVDNTVPTVSITSPVYNASVSGTTAINISAADNVGVTNVTLYVNGAIVMSFKTAPYSFNYAFTTDGTYTIKAVSKDAAGNSASHSIAVIKNTVIIINPPPTTLPSSFVMVAPPIMNQGGEGSCVSMALINQLSIEKYYGTNATSFNTISNVFSPEFLYNQTKASASCGSGASILNSINFIKNTGVCSWNTLPYDVMNGCDAAIITPSMTSEAGNNKIATFRYFLASDATAVKTALANKHPLSFTFQMDSNFYNSTPGVIWSSRGTMMYTHAITLIGYDDAKRAFKAVNAWGSTWGDQGYIWIDYDFFPTVAGYVYGMY